MCWSSNRKPVRQVAEKDIKVYKVLYATPRGTLRSPLHSSIWNIGVTKKMSQKMLFVNKPYAHCNLWIVNEGYHSFATKPKQIDGDWYVKSPDYGWIISFVNNSNNQTIFECTIPKGSIYYKNEMGEVVSNSLIVNKQCK